MSTRSARMLLVLVALTPISLLASAQGSSRNAAIVPAHATFKGLTYSEWTAKWWQAAFETPVEDGRHPFFDGSAFGGEDGVAFTGGLVMPAGSPTAVIPITIPAGTPLFLPVITVECSIFEDPPFHGQDEAELRACARSLMDLVSSVSAEIDGRTVHARRVESPLFQWGPVPAENFLGAPEGTVSDAVSDGYFLMLPPLSVGVHHIALGAAVEAFGVAVDTVLVITVEPRGHR